MYYTFTLKADIGTHTMTLFDTVGLINAINRICNIQGCPESAIINVKVKARISRRA